jgi:type I restriction enzyme, S subunit
MNKATEKGLVPELRFPEFQDSESWKGCLLGKVASFSKGKGVSKSDVTPNGKIPCIRYGQLYTHYKETIKEVISYTNSPLEELVLSKSNDVIIPASGETQLDIATASCIKKSGVALGGDLNIIRSKNDGVFLAYYLNSAKKNSIAQMAQGIAVVHLYANQLKNLEINLPEIKEQQKIADCLSSLDELVSAHNQKLDALKAHKKGLMQQLFPAEGETVPKLRFPEFSEAWTKSTIGMLIQNELIFPPKDGNHGNIHPKSSDYVKYGIPFIMANDIKNGEIDLLKCSHLTKEQADNLQKGFAKEGDVLLTHKGTVGSVTIVKENEFPYLMLTPQVTYYRVKDKEKLLNKFLAYSFISELFQGELKNASGGGTRAYIGITAQKNLNVAIAPTFDEQQKIADCLSAIDDLIIAQSQKIETLKSHKKGLMQQLFPSIDSVHIDAKAEVGA